MDEIFEALAFVLPLSLSDERFADPAMRAEIDAALDTLARSGAALEVHGSRRDAGFASLSRSLARDTRDIQRRFEEGRIPEARFLLHEVTENCVACHSRLPSSRDPALSRRLFDDERVKALPPYERGKLEMATRQFERGLATHEALFSARDADLASLDLEGYFDDYLEISIRVRGDLDRPLRTLRGVRDRGDLPPNLASSLPAWIASLERLQRDWPPAADLATARALMPSPPDERPELGDRASLVDYIAASSVLHRYASAPGRAPREAAEAYYLLGVIESRVGRSFWLSQTDDYLEAAIRLAPEEPFSEDAYALLEEFVVSGYTGSGGTRVPRAERARLDELRERLDAARAPASPPG